jgi:hypothetical protein
MTETPEQVQLRQHLTEMRRAAGGLGKDFEITFRNLDTSIARLSTRTAKDMKYDIQEIEDDFARLARAMDRELTAFPGAVRDKVVAGASAVGSGVARVAGATSDAIGYAGNRAREGTKNALASAAGVNRKPMKEWHTTTASSAADEQ